MAYRSPRLFPYPGAKTRLSKQYPSPKHSLIIEPFCGSACYSIWWRSEDRNVLLNDLSKDTCEIWEWLIENTTEYVLSIVPDSVLAGDLISELIPKNSPRAVLLFLQAHAAQGLGYHDKINSWSEARWNTVTNLIRDIHPSVSNWKITNQSYEDMSNQEATWFIDPPYQNHNISKQYEHSQIDFEHLSKWCRDRKGQVIVCEQEGADWLPFRPLLRNWGRNKAKSQGKVEVVWTNEKTGLLF